MKFPSLSIDYEKLRRELDYPGFCPHSDTVVRKKIASNGQQWFWNQCIRCGAKAGKRLSAKSIAEPSEVPEFDGELPERVWKEFHARILEREELERERLKKLWKQRYDEYLETDEWKVRRELVILRSQGICEGCRRNRASQVHHTTYQNVGEEFLFELVAVCRDCHDRYHKKVMPQFLASLWYQGYGRADLERNSEHNSGGQGDDANHA